MTTQIQVFNNTEFGELEIIEISGKPHFPATKCAEILGYINPRDAIAKHCNTEGVAKRDGVSLRHHSARCFCENYEGAKGYE